MFRSLCLCILVMILLVTPNSFALATFYGCGCEEEPILSLQSPYMSGPDIIDLQRTLTELGFFSGSATGVFGPLTDAALREFQNWAGLPVDGQFGPLTAQTLRSYLADQGAADPQASPPPGVLSLVVDLNTRILTVLVDGEVYETFPCTIGKPSTKTPVGEWTIISKGLNWGGGFGTRWMGLNVPWGIFGIHGTNKPGSIGTAASGGCIRLHNRHAERLYPWVKTGTRVTVLGELPTTNITAPLWKGQNGKAVQQLQHSLREAGYDPGLLNARFGDETEHAIKLLQNHYGLWPTGRADLNVLTLLRLR